jgi:SAM-dependent methyltransferase
MTATMTAQEQQRRSAETLMERLFEATIGTLDLFTVALGDRLGYYDVLANGPAMTSAEFASATGTHERYAREWLEQQAVTGILDVDDPGHPASERRYRLPEEYVPVLVDERSVLYGAPMARVSIGAVRPFDRLAEVYQNGGGLSFSDYGIDLMQGQAAMNRPQFEAFLASEWIAAMPDIEARLRRGDAWVADIGMGAGWSSIALAKAYPGVHVDGFDSDEASVEEARRNAEAEGVSDRVAFFVRDAGDPELAGQYALAMAFECIHDMSNPVAALAAMRRMVGDGGTVLVMDERVADAFVAPGDVVERFMYSCSVLHCLPVGMSGDDPAGTGTVMRRSTFEAYAEAAGFDRVDVLPIENDFFRFYRLTA